MEKTCPPTPQQRSCYHYGYYRADAGDEGKQVDGLSLELKKLG